MNEDFAYLLGALHDAHMIYRKDKGTYGFELEQKNKNYIFYLSKLIEKLFDKKIKIEKRKRSWGDYYRIRVHSKKIYFDIMKYSFNNLLKKSPSKIKKALVCGLFDAEGSVSSNEVRIFNKDIELLEITKQVIESFGIRCGKIVRTCGDVFQTPVYAKEHKNKFMITFKPKHPDKIKSF